MTNKILKNEMMSEEQLDRVAGGTIEELSELLAQFAKNDRLGGMFKNVSTTVPGLRTVVKNSLIKMLDKLNVEADIDLGFCDTGLNEKANKYKDKVTGESLTHQRVLTRILLST